MKNRLLFFLMAILLLAVASAQAQDASEFPMILWIRGDLYSVDAPDAAPTPVTTSGTISGPQLSPDGKNIAFKQAAQVGLDALDRITASGKIADFDLPGNIFLFDIAAKVVTPLVGQPPGASMLVDGVADKATIRSTPVWSPDGTRLAWTAYDYPDGKPELVIYNRVGGTETVVAQNLNAPLVQGAAPPLRWGTGGIAINTSVDATSEQDFLIYDENGTLLSTPRLAPVENDPAVDFMWVESPSGGQLGLIFQSAGWILIDPKTGVAQAAPELPRIMTAAGDSRAVRFGYDKNEGFFWEVVGETAAAPGSPRQVTLSPSGRKVAFTGFPSSGAVTIWDNGDTTSIPNTGSNLNELQVGAMLWGYTTWRIG
ncbi:MAG: hypothetical protein GC204_05695 [Chloroflexi bacterium]|nr:hypothetical protein [Chloroflexota bacterium]